MTGQTSIIMQHSSLISFSLRLPDGDVLLHAGDFSEFGEEEEVTEFREFLLSLSHPHKVTLFN